MIGIKIILYTLYNSEYNLQKASANSGIECILALDVVVKADSNDLQFWGF